MTPLNFVFTTIITLFFISVICYGLMNFDKQRADFWFKSGMLLMSADVILTFIGMIMAITVN